ncbi:MAG: ECF-type sigma factor [Singulisphaera sp.]
MPTDNQGPHTWLINLKGGDQDAARPLWDRYFQRLVSSEPGSVPPAAAPGPTRRMSRWAFGSFCDGAVRGRFPRLDSRDDFWRLLVKITINKMLTKPAATADSRGGGHVLDEAALVGLGFGGAGRLRRDLRHGPTPVAALGRAVPSASKPWAPTNCGGSPS